MISEINNTIDKSRIKQVLILIPLHRENLTSYLSPVLGQYGIRNSDFVKEFIKEFNFLTNSKFVSFLSDFDDPDKSLSEETLTIPVYLNVYKNGKYKLTVGYSFIGSLFRTLFKKRRYYKVGKFYRNYKKIFQLTVFYTVLKNQFSKLEDVYKSIRNSIHRKK